MDESALSISDTSSARKEYIVLVRGDWLWKFEPDQVITISKPLMIQGVLKAAETEFQYLASFSNPEIQPLVDDSCIQVSDPSNSTFLLRDMKQKYPFNPTACSLLLCRPKTGR